MIYTAACERRPSGCRSHTDWRCFGPGPAHGACGWKSFPGSKHFHRQCCKLLPLERRPRDASWNAVQTTNAKWQEMHSGLLNGKCHFKKLPGRFSDTPPRVGCQQIFCQNKSRFDELVGAMSHTDSNIYIEFMKTVHGSDLMLVYLFICYTIKEWLKLFPIPTTNICIYVHVQAWRHSNSRILNLTACCDYIQMWNRLAALINTEYVHVVNSQWSTHWERMCIDRWQPLLKHSAHQSLPSHGRKEELHTHSQGRGLHGASSVRESGGCRLRMAATRPLPGRAIRDDPRLLDTSDAWEAEQADHTSSHPSLTRGLLLMLLLGER